jgi:hypothetical protein
VPVPNIQWIIPDDGQGSCPKHVELCTKINLEISASVGFSEEKFITMHRHMNVKYTYVIEETGNEDSNTTALAHGLLYRALSSYYWVFCIRKAVGNMKQKLETEKLHFVHNLLN